MEELCHQNPTKKLRKGAKKRDLGKVELQPFNWGNGIRSKRERNESF